MRVQTDASQNSAVGVTPAAPWRVAELEVLAGYRLWVRFIDGMEGTVDMSRLVFAENAGVFAPLRNAELFAKACLEYGAVTWPGEIDLAPDAMYDAIREDGEWVLS